MNYQRKRVAKRLASGLLAGALALGGLAISGASPASAETPTTNRIAGVDRYDTAVALALATNATADHIVIVSGENYPDALAASGYAGKLYSAGANAEDAVILLTRAGALPDTVVNYLSNSSNLSTDAKAYIVGGTSVVSAAVEAQVKAITGLTPTRVSGTDRYSTAVELSKKIGNSTEIILVSGNGFADGVAASGWAFATDRAVLLSGATGLDTATKAEVKRLVTATPGLKVTIVGGAAAVPDAAISDLVGEGVAYANINRVAGADRYATATALNVVMAGAGGVGAPAVTFNASKVALVTGENYADAIAAAAYLGSTGTHTALVSSSGVPAGTAALVATVSPANPTSLVAIGGYSAVTNTTVASVVSAAQASSVFTPTITVSESAAASGVTATMKITKLPVAVTAAETCAAAACAVADTVSKWLGTESNYTINGVNLTVFATGGVAAATSAGGADSTVTITLPDGFSAAGVVVGFAGIAEGKANDNGTFSISAASATIADDATAPTFTVVRATANGVNGSNAAAVDGTSGKVWLLSSETLVGFAAADVSWATAAAAAKCTSDAAAATGNLWLLECKIADAGSNVDGQAIAATDTLTIALDGFTDVAGNAGGAAGATQVITVAAADATSPTLTRSATTTTATSASEFAISLTTGTCTVSTTALNPAHGTGGIGWRVLISAQTGNIPSVSLDATSKRIQVGVNLAKHSCNDIINAVAQNSGGSLGLVTVAASAGDGANKLSTAYISGDIIAPTVGQSQTVITLTASEVLSAIGNAGKFVNATCTQGTAPALAADGVTVTITCNASATPVVGLLDLGAAAATDLLSNASVATATGAGI